MNKDNYVLKLLTASVITLSVVVGIIYRIVWNNDNKLQGKLVFSETYNKGVFIDKIELISSEDSVVIVRKNNYWVIENKNNYYADFITINNLLNSLNKSIYSAKFPFTQEIADKKLLNNPDKHEKNSGILIKTYAKEQKIDEIIVGLSDESKNYYFSRNLKDDNIWLISENFNLPIYSRDWLIRPVVNMPEKQIEAIQIDGKEVRRLDKYTLFYNEKEISVDVKVLTDVLSGIYIVNAFDEKQFAEIKPDDVIVKNIKITTFLGLIFDVDLYHSHEGRVWCKIKLLTTSLPMTIINDYINDNKFLYEGWYFEISPEQGHLLRDFQLM